MKKTYVLKLTEDGTAASANDLIRAERAASSGT